MDYHLIGLSFVFFISFYFIGIKKHIRWLSRWKQFRVKDQERFAQLVGTYLLVVGISLLISGFVNYPYESAIIYIFTLGYGDLLTVYISNYIIE